jgi:serine/threonine protein kinase
MLRIPRTVGRYLVHKVIGEGTSSIVLEGTDQWTGQICAIKAMSCFGGPRGKTARRTEEEIAILRTLNHANICQLIDVIRHYDLVLIVMETCNNGDLLSYILDGNMGDKTECVRVFKQIAEAIQHVHQLGYAHGDIKPENIMLDEDRNAKLIDFGYAKRSRIAGEDEKAGTLPYTAPELLKSGSFQTQKADIWALGIVFFVMAAQIFPYKFADRQELCLVVGEGVLTYPPEMDPQTESLIRRMTALNPNERPSIDEVLCDPMLSDISDKMATTGPEITLPE